MRPADLAATHTAAFGKKGWDTAEFTRLAEQPGVTVHGDITSFAVIRRVADEAEILTLATHPDAQGTGRATMMLDQALLQLKMSDVSVVFLEVAADNTAACALYARAGFGRVAERKEYYRRADGGRITALILRKDL